MANEVAYIGGLRKEPYVVLFHYTEEQGYQRFPYRATVYKNGHEQVVRYHKTKEEVREKYVGYFGEKEVGALRFVDVNKNPPFVS